MHVGMEGATQKRAADWISNHTRRDASVGADDMMDRSCQCQNSQNQSGADKVHFSRAAPPGLIALFLYTADTGCLCESECLWRARF